jgi:RimJ/RimL family protein N-acetyltransferase
MLRTDTCLEGTRCRLRPWRREDAEPLAALANNRAIWRNLSDRMPHPYTLDAANAWLDTACAESYDEYFRALEVDGRFAGAGGFKLAPLERRFTGEIGYWIGEPYWGQGIGTELVALLTAHGFAELGLQRIQAQVYAWNPTSARVLEKNGYQREAVLERAVFKDGEFVDVWMYAKLKGG